MKWETALSLFPLRRTGWLPVEYGRNIMRFQRRELMSLEGFARHTKADTRVHGRSWLSRMSCSGVWAAGRDWQQLPITHPILLPPLLHAAVLMPAPARASRASPRKAAPTPRECIYIIFVHYTVPNSCLLVFTHTSHTLFSACVPTQQHILSILGQEAQNFRRQLYNEHSKIKAAFIYPH